MTNCGIEVEDAKVAECYLVGKTGSGTDDVAFFLCQRFLPANSAESCRGMNQVGIGKMRKTGIQLLP
ncbi:MAG: hypothetical protein DRH04_05120 [Deltaproteobacteria bacterium]|nr:MAG: hypothetical protein DRH04_05120 [Deltaproteobacteria bacterium]